MGGDFDSANPYDSAELYYESLGQFSNTASLFCPRQAPQAVELSDHTVLVTGPSSVFTPEDVAEIYSPSTGMFGQTGKMIDFRSEYVSTLLQNGEVLITGGLYWDCQDVSGGCTAECQTGTDLGPFLAPQAEVYDPAAGVFMATGSLNDPRSNPSAALLQDGRVLIAAGNDNVGIVAQAEVFDPTSGTFSITGSLPNDRSWDLAVTLQNGQVLLLGGEIANQQGLTNAQLSQTGAELYDPATSAFAATGDMTSPRSGGESATLLLDGRVLVAGGSDCIVFTSNGSTVFQCTALSSAELYDPTTESFTSTGAMTTARVGHSALRLADGTVLLAGGDLAQGQSAEIYSPSSGTFSATGDLNEGRDGAAGVPLK